VNRRCDKRMNFANFAGESPQARRGQAPGTPRPSAAPDPNSNHPPKKFLKNPFQIRSQHVRIPRSPRPMRAPTERGSLHARLHPPRPKTNPRPRRKNRNARKCNQMHGFSKTQIHHPRHHPPHSARTRFCKTKPSAILSHIARRRKTKPTQHPPRLAPSTRPMFHKVPKCSRNSIARRCKTKPTPNRFHADAIKCNQMQRPRKTRISTRLS